MPRPIAPRRRPVCPAGGADERQPGGDRDRLARAPSPPSSGRGRREQPGAGQADQRRPRLVERPRACASGTTANGARQERRRGEGWRPRASLAVGRAVPSGRSTDPGRRSIPSPSSSSGSRRLNADELDRLAAADPAPIAFGATIRRFLPDDRRIALEAIEGEVARRLSAEAAARPGIRDTINAYAAELVLGPFLDDLLSEPFRARTRERLTRGWDAAVGQPRYGPNGQQIRSLVARLRGLDRGGVAALAAHGARDRLGDDPWPPGTSPDDDEALRVSSVLAAQDAAVALPDAGLDRRVLARARRAAARMAHLLVLRHAFAPAAFAAPHRALATEVPAGGPTRGSRSAATRRLSGPPARPDPSLCDARAMEPGPRRGRGDPGARPGRRRGPWSAPGGRRPRRGRRGPERRSGGRGRRPPRPEHPLRGRARRGSPRSRPADRLVGAGRRLGRSRASGSSAPTPRRTRSCGAAAGCADRPIRDRGVPRRAGRVDRPRPPSTRDRRPARSARPKPTAAASWSEPGGRRRVAPGSSSRTSRSSVASSRSGPSSSTTSRTSCGRR